MPANPVDDLLEELLRAHDRQLTAHHPASTRSRRRLRRPVFVVPAVLLAFTASAVAAIVIGTHRSAALKGVLPRQLLGSRYSLTVAPDLSAGHVGWCISLLTVISQAPVLSDPAYCVPATDDPLITRGGLLTLSPQLGTIKGSLLYAIVRRNVYALRRPDGTRILPISSPDLPKAWRAAVTIQTAVKWPPSGVVFTLVPIAANGSAYPTTPSRSSIALKTVPVSAGSDARTGCRVVISGRSRLHFTDARALGVLPGKVTAASPAFLSCFSAGLSIDGRASRVALLVNPADPRSVPGLLPGSRPVPGAPGIWVSAAVDPAASAQARPEHLYVKRAGDALLALETSAPRATAVASLDNLHGLG